MAFLHPLWITLSKYESERNYIRDYWSGVLVARQAVCTEGDLASGIELSRVSRFQVEAP